MLISKVRSAVEHVFAHQKGLVGLVVRTIGIARAETKIGLANLAYNMRRFVWLKRRTPSAFTVPIEAIEARNVLDGRKLVTDINTSGQTSYPFGLSGLPPVVSNCL
jgi:hypothetical protein